LKQSSAAGAFATTFKSTNCLHNSSQRFVVIHPSRFAFVSSLSTSGFCASAASANVSAFIVLFNFPIISLAGFGSFKYAAHPSISEAETAPTTSWGNLHIDAQSNGTLSVHVLGISTTGNANAAAAQLESFVGAKASARSISVKSHLEAVKYLGGGTTSPRQGFLAGSDVLKGAMDAATITALLGAVKAAARAKTPASAILDPLGGQASKQPAGGASWPWRSALGVVQWYSSAQGTTAKTFITNGHRAVRSASAGAYVNYLEAGRAVSSYYGGSAAKLQAAKKKYDPSNFFHTPYTLA